MPMMYADSSDAYAATLIGADAAEDMTLGREKGRGRGLDIFGRFTDFFRTSRREARQARRKFRARRKPVGVGCAECPLEDYIQVGATARPYIYGGEAAWGVSPQQELPASVWNQQLFGMIGQDIPPEQLYEKNRERLSRFPAKVAAIRSTSAQRELSKELAPLLALRDELAPAFASGAKPGARDLDKLKLLDRGVDAIGRKIRAAEKAYGVGAPAPAVPMAAPKAADPIPPAPPPVPVAPGDPFTKAPAAPAAPAAAPAGDGAGMLLPLGIGVLALILLSK